MAARFKVYKTRGFSGEYYWNLKSRNGQTIAASSEGFSSKQGALRNAKLTVEELSAALKELDSE